MNKPKISVLMSVYNGEKYLAEVVDSVLRQTLKDFEFIIVDDCSTDSSRSVLESYSDDRIRLIYNDENLGLTKSLNRALKEVKGEYIARLDADDINREDRFEKQAAFLEGLSDIDVAFSEIQNIDEKGERLYTISRINSPEEIYYYLYFINPLIHPTAMFHKNILDKFGKYDESYKYAQDFELWNRLKNEVKFGKFPEALVFYRKDKEQISRKSLPEQSKYASKIYRRNLSELKLSSAEIKEAEYFHTKAFQENSKDITISKLKLLIKINKLIIEKAPSFLDKSKVKRAARIMFYYYVYCYARKGKVLNPALNLLRRLVK